MGPKRPGVKKMRFLLALLVAAMITFPALAPTMSRAGGGLHFLWFIGFSSREFSASSFEFRQAIAHALDREVIAKAIQPHIRDGGVAKPAFGIQHPRLPGYDPEVRGYAYDLGKGKALYERAGSPKKITIFAGPPREGLAGALDRAVIESLRRLGTEVLIQPVASFEALSRQVNAGRVAIYMMGWRGEKEDFGYPSFALGLAHDTFSYDQEVKRLVKERDPRAVEQYLLEKALVIPLAYR